MKKGIDFLLKIWAHTCKPGETIYLSTKSANAGKWLEHPFCIDNVTRESLAGFFAEYPPEKYDLYFCPTSFNGPRKKKYVNPLNILWSDIDEGKPKLKPSILWESSPGRLQGLWFMGGDRLLAEDGEALNKALTYYMGDADSSGWDITQVLRIPGTLNHKYESTPVVRVLEENDDLRYTPRKIARSIGFNFDVPEPVKDTTTLAGKTFEAVYSKYKKKIPLKIKRLLTQKARPKKGNRSEILWFIENRLLEAGIPPDEIKVLVKHSVWNKFKGREDEDYRLQKEVENIIETKITLPVEQDVEQEIEEELTAGLEIQSFYDLMTSAAPSPGWLVKGWWLNKSHGIVAGEPKCFKSTLALDLAISVASGNDFLGEHEVISPGPVVYIQNENAQWIMKDRVAKISVARGVVGEVEILSDRKVSITWPQDIPFFMVNQQSFLLTDPIHQQLLEKIIQTYKPVLVVLDPLYLMFDGDINSAKDLNPILSWMLEIRIKYDCGVMLVHHSNKGGENKRGGQRMLGSTTLHGWTESAWYIKNEGTEDDDEDPADDINQVKAMAEVTVEREFRGAGMHPEACLNIMMGEIGSLDYNVKSKVHTKKAETKKNQDPLTAEREILRFVRTAAHTEIELADKTGYTKLTVQKAVDYLAEKGKVKRKNNQVHLSEDKYNDK